MSILLAKHHDITEFASKDQTRYVLNSVHYNAEKKLIESTDGHIAIRVPVVQSEEFPPVKGQCEALPADVIMPIAQFKKALGNAPKNGLEILRHARLDAPDSGKLTLTTTDMDCEQAVTCKAIEGQYPKMDAVWPDKAPEFTISLAADVLIRMGQYAQKHSIDEKCTVNLQFTDSLSPVRFSINLKDVNGDVKAVGVAMPVRIT